MFKKKPTVKPLAPLRSSDRRKLADQIITDYGLQLPAADDQSPEQKAEATAAHSALRASLLPDNIQSARFATTHGPDLKPASGTFYIGSQSGQDARILWFQLEGRIYPSVYTLWKHPDIVALLFTPDIVVKKLQGGADLMTPGLAGGPPFPSRATKDAIAAIASTNSPTVPVAVGVCKIDVSGLEVVQGAKGHAVETVHWVGDELWSYSVAGKPGQSPPDEIEGWAKVLEEQGLTEKTEALNLDDDEADDGGVTLEAGDNATPPSMNDGSAPEAKKLTQPEIDAAFRDAFIYGVYQQKLTNSSAKHYGLVFPLSQSSIMATLVQPFLPAFTPEESQQLQIKKSSWKTIKKFVKSLHKDQQVKSKDTGNETVILDIDFEDVAFTSFKPYRLPKKDNGPSDSSNKAAENGDAGSDDSVGQKLQVLTLYKPTSKLQPLFTNSEASGPKQLFTPSEVREIVTSYVERESLISESNKRLVKLDPTLGNAVFDGSGSLDKEVLSKGSVPRDALIDRVLHAMAPSYAIVRNEADSANVKAKSGTPPKIRITLERRAGSKTVTRVSGLEMYHINARALADELRKVCAGSTSIEPLAGATKKNEKEIMEVMIQGPQKDAVIKALEKRGVLNIPELLELVLLSLPGNTIYEEISACRTILLSCTTARTWYSLIQTSPSIRRRLYLPTCDRSSVSNPWSEQSAFPPAQPNPWIPLLLLNQRSWGSSYPFDNSYSAFNLAPSQPKFWTFSFEMSRAQYSRLPPPGAWRDMLAALPPFTDIWYTRCFYELGSGRAPFVTHWDYDAKKPKSQQQYRVHSDQGITLGMIADAMTEMFEKYTNARFVLVESLHAEGKVADDRPAAKAYLPGSSAEEREYAWY
ncbi:Hypothetical protein R9X50_00696200 [Acrodontium crateriforme]|uniref:SUI1 domain-containing protein n=1 Tax=Acrodontium crateriforme TaxID=150365 RepID=A0AAQ3M8U6_9PEZI|nr:Hypothetical protein R9X50_00696200 [Acrodontium crateriforme]